MTTTTKTLFFGFALTIASLIAYCFIRPGMVENKYIERVQSQSNNIAWLCNSFEKEKPLNKRNLAQFRKNVTKRFGRVPFLAIADSSRTILNKDSLERSNELYFSIIKNFEEGKILKDPGLIIRHHKHQKHYIVMKPVNGGFIISSFPFSLARKTYIKLGLEIFLVVLISILITTIIYVFSSRKHTKKTDPVYRTGKATSAPKPSPVVIDGQNASRELSNFASETLGTYVYDLFKQLSTSYSPDHLSLYIMNKESESMAKSFEMRGHSFLKIDSDNFDAIDVNNEVGNELKNASTLVLENGNRVILPVMFRNSLLGALILHRGIPFKGPEITDIKQQLATIARYLSEYIFFNDVAIDEDTGLYSTVYFNLKLRETKRRFSAGNHYTVILISQIGDDTFLDDNQHTELIKSTAMKIMGQLRDDDILCRVDNNIAALLPDISLDESIQRAEAIINVLIAAKIKILKTLKIKPVLNIGIASTENLGPDEDLISAAHQHLALGRRRGENLVHYSPVRSV